VPVAETLITELPDPDTVNGTWAVDPFLWKSTSASTTVTAPV
jgi:hypothetical protein